jgi:hypothetical protein
MVAVDPMVASVDRGNHVAGTDRGPTVATEHDVLLPPVPTPEYCAMTGLVDATHGDGNGEPSIGTN